MRTNTKQIIVKEGAKYLSEVINELPANCLFNKGVTGCGGTTLELMSNRPSIIAMPTINLIDNKAKAKGFEGKLLAVHSNTATSKDDIIEYINNTDNFKILVTYDSVPKILECLKEISYPIEKIFLLVDEYHLLLNQYAFRNIAISNMLKAAKHFKMVTYMSATPIKKDYILTELQDLEVINVTGWNTIKPNVKILQARHNVQKVAKTIQEHLTGNKLGNLHFFINSVRDISKIINRLSAIMSKKDITSSIRVVCSDNPENKQKLSGYKDVLSSINSPVKKINFYTSTAFEGCDIYDEQGIIYIVSDQNQDQTKLDIYTQIPQIIGRIRNQLPMFANTVYHIISGKAEKTLTPEQLEQEIQHKKINMDCAFMAGENILNKYKEDSTYWETADIAKLWNRFYIQFDENKEPYINRNVLYYELASFEIIMTYIPSILANVYENNNYNSELGALEVLERWKEGTKKPSFHELFETYVTLKNSVPRGLLGKFNPEYDQAREDLNRIETTNPFVKKAFDLLGAEEVLKDNCLSNIKRKIIAKEAVNDSSVNKVYKMIKDTFKSGGSYPVADIKAELQACYEALGIKNTAKATDLENYFHDCKRYTKRINGKPTEIISIEGHSRIVFLEDVNI